jgi:hypothetical protein
MGNKEGGGLAGLFGKAEKWFREQGVTKEDMEKAKADREALDERAAAEHQGEERADRSTRAGDSNVTLRGATNGTIDSGLSAKTEQDGDQLIVTVEPVDPVAMEGRTFAGYTFAIPSYTGPGTYDLGTTDVSGMMYELYLGSEEGFFWAPEYGPGIVTVSDGGKTMQVHFVFQDPGSNKVDLEGTVKLT